MGQEYKQFRKPQRTADGSYVVSDLYYVGFLIARGNQAIGIEPSGQPGRWAFVIAPGATFAADVAAWESNQPIPIRDFIDAIYLAKGLMREA